MARNKYRLSPVEDLQTLIVELNQVLSKITVQFQRLEGLDGYTTVFKGPINHTGTTFGVLSATPAAQQSSIANLSATPSDAEIQTAVNSIITVLETFGFVESN